MGMTSGWILRGQVCQAWTTALGQ